MKFVDDDDNDELDNMPLSSILSYSSDKTLTVN